MGLINWWMERLKCIVKWRGPNLVFSLVMGRGKREIGRVKETSNIVLTLNLNCLDPFRAYMLLVAAHCSMACHQTESSFCFQERTVD